LSTAAHPPDDCNWDEESEDPEARRDRERASDRVYEDERDERSEDLDHRKLDGSNTFDASLSEHLAATLGERRTSHAAGRSARTAAPDQQQPQTTDQSDERSHQDAPTAARSAR
jgi:hypothetical protein